MKYAVAALAFLVVALPSCCMRKKNGKAKSQKVEKVAKPCPKGKCPTKAMPKGAKAPTATKAPTAKAPMTAKK